MTGSESAASVVRPTPGGVSVRVPLTLQRTSGLRAPQPTDASPPAVLVTPRLAELAGGVGEVSAAADRRRLGAVRVAGVVERFPGTSGESVVGDRIALRTAINAAAPGAARENEVWLDVEPDRRAAVTRALDAAAVSRARRDRRGPTSRRRRGAIRSPTGRCSRSIGTAAVALLLAALGLALAVASDLRDDSGEQFDLEAQGASPAFLRRVVRARARDGLASAGSSGALATGLALAAPRHAGRHGHRARRRRRAAARRRRRSAPSSSSASSRSASLAVVLVGGATRRAFAGRTRARVPGDRLMAPLVDARELFAVYPSAAGGVAALQGLTLAVDEGEICVVLGPSGSGKTTFMRVLAGLARPSAGSLVVAGVDVLHASAARARRGIAATFSGTPTSTTGARSRAS